MAFSIGVVIVCAGKGKRLGGINKALLKLGGKPLFVYSLEVFLKLKFFKQIVLVMRKESFSAARKYITDKRVELTEGGRQRRDSVLKGLKALSRGINYVLVHDAARPFISAKEVAAIIKELKKHPAVICGIQPVDTLKNCRKNQIRETLNRDNVICAQTPQGFKTNILRMAYEKFPKKNFTDDAQAVERLKVKVKVAQGQRSNFKITYPQDIELAKIILKR
ncbi:MAG: 2-C-methyl-D-erythritol 4-phosphate cytidylyltransferase, partial [Candidatus Omnitrophica bacterium]|nr:2-C-methyl-D-erythritol 4-phosphate cytidylyltransferase [Candidatus Omnitrophota bacterium]